MTTLTTHRATMLEFGESKGLEALGLHALRLAWEMACADIQQGLARLTSRNRIATDAAAVQARLISAQPPEGMEAAPVAPARGAMRFADNVAAADEPLLLSNRGEWQVRAVFDGQRWEGDCRLSDMNAQAWRAHVKAGGDEAGFVAPFTPGQIQMGQHYAMLVERYDAGGMKCTTIGGSTGGGSGGDFMDAYLKVGDELRLIRSRIGAGQAMAVRRVRPSARGEDAVPRRGISDRALVDMVCLGGMDMTAVLEAHGWNEQTKHRVALRAALSACLDRVQGYSSRSPKKRIDA